MDQFLPHHHEPDLNSIAGDSRSMPQPEEEEPITETLMEALARVISVDEETQHIEGCADDFRQTEAVLRRHDQEDVAEQVLALLRAQGAMCDCEVLLNSRIDLVFLEDDIEYEDDEDDVSESVEDEFAT
jgi:hypothetical protein